MTSPDTSVGGILPAPEYWQAWFDGSAFPNPGRMGIGIVLQAPNGQRQLQSLMPRESGCNNEAELHALCAVLLLAHEAGARCVQIRGDSDVAVRYVNRTDSTVIERIRLLVERAQALIATFDDVQLSWVPRHRNQAADDLSRAALGLPSKPAVVGQRRREK